MNNVFRNDELEILFLFFTEDQIIPEEKQFLNTCEKTGELKVSPIYWILSS